MDIICFIASRYYYQKDRKLHFIFEELAKSGENFLSKHKPLVPKDLITYLKKYTMKFDNQLIKERNCLPVFFLAKYQNIQFKRNKTEIAALSASRRREKLTWQTKITLDDNSACSIQDYRN